MFSTGNWKIDIILWTVSVTAMVVYGRYLDRKERKP
jgi:hypothetical protein